VIKKIKNKRGHTKHNSLWLTTCVALFIFTLPCKAENTASEQTTPRISIIIDDLGDHYDAGHRAIQLEGAITYAFLPHSPHSKKLAIEAHQQGKEVMLHLPMQSMGQRKLGPGALTMDMSYDQFQQTFRTSLRSVPYASGINNHMGSLLTRHPGHMQWLMEELNNSGGLYFVDSRTTHHTVAERLAQENNIPTQRRDIFLDDDPSPSAVAHQLERLIKKAKKEGTAIAIGHPYNSTLSLLEKQLPKLVGLGIKLLPVSQLINASSKTQKQPRPIQAKAVQPDHLVLNQNIELQIEKSTE
jgi:polysaccharide deacetylase 2 family uncharacterized protein YibQ